MPLPEARVVTKIDPKVSHGFDGGRLSATVRLIDASPKSSTPTAFVFESPFSGSVNPALVLTAASAAGLLLPLSTIGAIVPVQEDPSQVYIVSVGAPLPPKS